MLHVAILLKPYLDLVLSGEKTVECRLTQQARAPYCAIEPGHRVFFKQSAGPYRATAVAERVLFESTLTPRRVERLKAQFNDQVRGDDGFWHRKRHSRFASLIWLRDVEATDRGPVLPRQRGVAWIALDGEQDHPTIPAGSFTVPVTAANLRHGTLYTTRVMDALPAWAMGGRTRAEAARPLTLKLEDGPTVETDIVAGRKAFRTRVWREWLRRQHARAGDQVVFTRVGRDTYTVEMSRG